MNGFMASPGEIKLATRDKPQRKAAGVAAVDRALAIIAAIESRAAPSTLAELSAATDLCKSTILRLLASLENAGYVVRLRDGRYALGPMTFRLGLSYERANPLREHALPVLRDLVEHGTESASLHIRHDATSRICLLRIDSHHSTLDRVRAGDIFPLERGAAGRILLAFGDQPGEIYDHFRQTFFAISMGERDPECAGLASPVFGPDGALRAALSLSGPRERFNATTIGRMHGQLLAAARTVTAALGGSYPRIAKKFDAAAELARAVRYARMR